jgi:DNA-binding transcriptional regulator YhcF (GntR family)
MTIVDLTVDRDSDLPLGTQLALTLQHQIASGRLAPGDRMPSVREAASAAGVNVGTVRAVYARLEADGLVRSEQGRGTFVAEAQPQTEAGERRELRRQIALLEAALVRFPPAPEKAGTGRTAGRGPALLSTDDLARVRDVLLERLRSLDRERAELVQQLEELGARRPAEATRTSSSSLSGARIRWVGA